MAEKITKTMMKQDTIDSFAYYRSAKQSWLIWALTLILYPFHLFHFPISTIKYDKHNRIYGILSRLALTFVIISLLCGGTFLISSIEIKQYSVQTNETLAKKEIDLKVSEVYTKARAEMAIDMNNYNSSITAINSALTKLETPNFDYEAAANWNELNDTFAEIVAKDYFKSITYKKDYIEPTFNKDSLAYSVVDYKITREKITLKYNPKDINTAKASFLEAKALLNGTETKEGMKVACSDKYAETSYYAQKDDFDFEKALANLNVEYKEFMDSYIFTFIKSITMYGGLGCFAIANILLFILTVFMIRLSNLKDCKELEKKLNELGFNDRDFRVLVSYSKRQYHKAFTDYIKNKQRIMDEGNPNSTPQYNPYVQEIERPEPISPFEEPKEPVFIKPAEVEVAPKEVLDTAAALLDPFYTDPLYIGNIMVEAVCNLVIDGETYSLVRDSETGDFITVHIIKDGKKSTVEVVNDQDIMAIAEEKYYDLRTQPESKRVLDPNYKDHIVIFGSGGRIKFRQLFSCAVNGKKYCFLRPSIAGMEDSGILFEIGDTSIDMVADKGLTNAVYKEYVKYANSHTHMVKM